MQLFANNADSELNGAISPSTLSLTLKAGGGAKFPTPTGGDFFLVTLYQKMGATESNHEILKCTARSGDVLTVERAQENSTAKAFANADPVELRETAGTLASKANVSDAYVHPVNHPASIITQDASNRFVTDAEKVAWNAKQPAGSYATGGGTATGTNTGDQDLTTYATKLGVETLANKALLAPIATGLKEVRAVVAASTLDLTTANLFTKTVTSLLTWAVTNTPAAGTVASFMLDLTNGGAFAQTWWTGVKWAGGIAPILTASGRDVLGFYTHDGGTTWTGLMLGKDVK